MPKPKHRDRTNDPPVADSPLLSKIREANEHLLIAGLHEQELAEQLRRQLAFTNVITDTLGEGICALDGDRRITFVNPAASQLLGWTEEELVGRDLHEIVHADCSSDCPLRDALWSDTACRYDGVFLRQDGTPYPVTYSIAPIIADTRADGTVIAFRDIAVRQRLVEAQARLLAHEQTARSAAEASAAARTEVLNVVSHDLRQPLTVIQGMVQLLTRQVARLETPEQGRVLNGLERIDNSARKMTAIVNELLDVAQLVAGQQLMLERHTTDLVALMRRVVADHQSVTARQLTLETIENSLMGSWDALRLERVFANLLSNATKYSPGDRPVVVRLRRDHGATNWAIIEVLDEGIGIPEADLPYIFNRFHRGSNAARLIAGVGLGLAGSKHILEQHGGSISILSVEGSGTTVVVRLPGVE